VDTVQTVDFELSSVETDEVLVQVAHSVISPGTELRCLAGKQPGSAPWGFVPGYACAGTLEDGRRVFCGGTHKIDLPKMWGGHVSHAILHKSQVYDIPDNVSTVEAPVAKLAAISLRGVLVSKPEQGEKVAVVGLGMIGQLSTRQFKAAGADVYAFDTDATRVELAKHAGINAFLIEGELADFAKSINPDLFGIVVEATGVPAVLAGLYKLLMPLPWGDSGKEGPKVVIQASYPETFILPYQEYFTYETTFFMPRDNRPADIRYCLQLMSEGKLQVRDLVSEVLPASRASDAYQKLVNREQGYTTAAFDWKA
jgi:2-desacetyl-2-hydroxyethyl bacteriochlorophyllide A dehydrogenase